MSSIVHYIERMNVQRDYVQRVAQINDGLGIEAHIKMKAEKQSQLEIQRVKTPREKRLARRKNEFKKYYEKHKERRFETTNKWLRQAKKNPQYREYLNALRRKSYHKRQSEKIAELGVETIREFWREQKRNQEAQLSKEQKRERYEKRRAREIQQCGGIEGYREKKRLENQKTREKKKQEKQNGQ